MTFQVSGTVTWSGSGDPVIGAVVAALDLDNLLPAEGMPIFLVSENVATNTDQSGEYGFEVEEGHRYKFFSSGYVGMGIMVSAPMWYGQHPTSADSPIMTVNGNLTDIDFVVSAGVSISGITSNWTEGMEGVGILLTDPEIPIFTQNYIAVGTVDGDPYAFEYAPMFSTEGEYVAVGTAFAFEETLDIIWYNQESSYETADTFAGGSTGIDFDFSPPAACPLGYTEVKVVKT